MINREGKGHWFRNRDEALAFAKASLAEGRPSFDVGCFQINYRYHGMNFPLVEAMFHPDAGAVNGCAVPAQPSTAATGRRRRAPTTRRRRRGRRCTGRGSTASWPGIGGAPLALVAAPAAEELAKPSVPRRICTRSTRGPRSSPSRRAPRRRRRGRARERRKPRRHPGDVGGAGVLTPGH